MAKTPTYALAPSQLSFWALHEIFPESHVGNVAIRFRLRGPLRHDAMLRAIQRLARRFDSWRTRYLVEQGGSGLPIAVVETLDPYPIDAIDLSALPRVQAEARLQALFADRLTTRFDLTRDAAMRVSFVRLSEDDHALQFCGHHIALDGTSIHDVLGRLLAAEYHAIVRTEPEAAPTTPSFEAFARAQCSQFSDPERASLRHFRTHLDGASPALDLATDRRRPRTRSWRGARVELPIDARLRTALAARAAQLGASLPDLLLCAFFVQLQRYSRQDELLVGVANGNRRDPNLRDLFGCVLVTLPMRCALHDDPTLAEVVQRVRSEKRAAYAHLDPGLDQVLAQLGGGHDARAAGYQAVFNYMNHSAAGLQFEGLQLETEYPDPGWTSSDLSLDVQEQPSGLRCTLEYAAELFEAQTAQRYIEHYRNVLAAIAAQDDAQVVRVSQLSMLGQAERRRMLDDFNATRRAYPAERSLHVILREAMLAAGAHVAVTSGHRELSHAALLVQARTLAHRLRALGALPGQRVLLMFEDPIDAVVAMLATLEAGAAYVPLDPGLPAERVAALLAAVAPVAILSSSMTELALPAGAPQPLYVDVIAHEPAMEAELCEPHPGPEDPAYIIFTSGSTGVPKGVVVRHRNIVSQVFARLLGYAARPARMLLPHSFAFDAPIGGLYWTLASGGTLVLPDAQARRDPNAIAQLIERFAVTHMDIVPSLYAELIALDAPGRLRSLTTVLIGGEACTAALAARHFERLPRTELINEYGPTETTVHSTLCTLRPEGLSDPLPIGHPILNTRCYVLDARQNPVPLGIPGELYIGGDGVALGYLNDPVRTAERFVQDPFAQEPGARMYRTGDLVRLRPDGELEFLGRIDRQVKVRGFRVELGEIEAVLLRRPQVTGAVAVARNDEGGGHIDAYVTLKHAPGDSAREGRVGAELRRSLRGDLPAYMVPSHVQVLERIPLTPAGKIDIRALPRPAAVDVRQEDPGTRYVEPRTQTEQRLAQLWAEMLSVPRVGMLDDFFELGGHSLLAVRMLSLVAAREGVHVPLSAFFHRPTVSHLAALLHRDAALPEESLIVNIQEGTRPPFWLLHPVGGHVVFARRLAVHLDPEQPLYGIQAQGLDGQREPLRTIEAMAERYLGLIREQQPSGPYYLGGHSLGGLIAFELARRLHASGERVAMLALFDTPGADYPRRTSLPVRLADHARQRALRLRDWVLGRVRSNGNGVEAYRNYDPLRNEQKGGALMDAIARVHQCNTLAATTYQRQPYPGPIHFFRAQQTPDWPGMRFDDPHGGWGRLATRVEVVPLECTHQNMMDEPAVSQLGRELQLRLLACQQAEERPAFEPALRGRERPQPRSLRVP